MSCPECGFRTDSANESQVVCPACGADPTLRPDEDSELAAAFEEGAAFAETPVSLADVLADHASTDPEIGYVADPELDVMIADSEALLHALMEGPILVAGNKLVN